MWFGKRAPRTGSAGRRGPERPRLECLEHRVLLAIDLGGVTPPSSPVATSPLPNIATVPFGIDMAGGNSSGGAGFSVTDVGDVNNDGFEDFVIGSPTVVNTGGQVTLGTGHNSTAYLIFGSNQVNSGTINWLALTNPTLRVGDLVQLGNTPGVQTNPINGQTGFAFNGIKFITSQETSSQLGASVAAIGRLNNQNAFILGAPGGTVSSNPPSAVQGGRAFLIYGGSNLTNLSGATIDLDNPSNQGVNFISFVTTATGAQVGASVAGPGDVFADQTNDVAIGAPGATYNGQPNAGVAILIDGGALPLPTGSTTILVDAVGQSGGTRGVIFGGPNAGNRVGATVGGAGDINNAITGANSRIDDFLIGAPDIATTYLVYGGTGLVNLATPVGSLNSINLNRLGAAGAAPNTVLGATIVGEPGDGTGFALATAGDFNADGSDDFLIGSPFFNNNEGRVTMFYGQNITSNNLFGLINLDTIPTNDPAIQYLGAAAGSLAGYAVAPVGRINQNQPNPILIGSPGFAGNTGAAYLIPGNFSTPVGNFNLSTAESQPVAATQLTLTTPGGPSAPFFGASVSGRLFISGQGNTADLDRLGDFIIGAPGYAATGTRGLDGGAMILEGALIPIQTPISTSITTTISVDAPESVPPPYPVNATTPSTIQIFVESVLSANFDPVRDINPATIVVNGVAFTAAQVSIAKDPVDENNDGIEDAIITLTPRSALGLNASVTSLTITGRTLASSPIPNKTFIGTTTITVTGGGGGGGGAAAGAFPIGFVQPTFFQPPFGPEMFVPKPSTLSAFNYKPIPKRVAYYQFQPDLAFKMRILNYEEPGKYHFQATRTRSPNKKGSSFVLPSSTFTHSSLFHPGKKLAFKHHGPVIPTQFQYQNLTPRHR